MDIRNLQEHHHELVEHMHTVGYSANYIQQIRREIRLILEAPDKWNSYEEIMDFYSEQFPKKKAATYRPKIGIIKRFDLEGKLPRDSSTAETRQSRENAYFHLNEQFAGMIDYYEEHADSETKKAPTIYNECRNTASFLYHLQCNGITTLSQVDQKCILEVLTKADGSPSKSASYLTQLLAVFRSCGGYSSECNRIALLLPVMRKRRKNIQYLQADERTSIKEVLRKEESKLPLREKAIGCLLYYNGLRCSDIANLRFSDIDWEKEEISICQQKTDVPMKLPLTATVGNAIYDYIVNERGDSDCEYIFLSKSYPFQKLKAGSIGSLTGQIYDEANIRLNPGDHRGGHLFRHNFATAMLENGASRAVISKALGHTSPVSTEVYLTADMVHLKECALSIEAFPVREGVFTSERI